MKTTEDITKIIFEELHKFSRIEQLYLLEEELLTLLETFEETDIREKDGDVIDLFSEIEDLATYEKQEQIWESVETKLKDFFKQGGKK